MNKIIVKIGLAILAVASIFLLAYSATIRLGPYPQFFYTSLITGTSGIFITVIGCVSEDKIVEKYVKKRVEDALGDLQDFDGFEVETFTANIKLGLWKFGKGSLEVKMRRKNGA